MRRLLDWLDNRTGYRGVLDHLLREPLPPGTGWFFTSGSVVLFLMCLQALTGVTLTMYYVPTPSAAYETVRYLTDQIPFGGLVRGLHFWGASILVIAAVVHAMRVFLFGSYKAPREVTWFTGLVLLLLTLAFALTGYLLPWDQKAYWATTVTINIARSTPWLGDGIARLMRGGSELGALTLGRWYTAHVFLLPAAVAVFVAAHLALMRRHGISGPIRPQAGHSVPFFPWHAIKDTVLIAAVFALLLAVAAQVPAPLDEIANPADTGYDPRPEWYFLALFQLLKYFPGRLEPVATLVIPLLIVGFLVALPFLDRGSDRHPFSRSRRPLTVTMLLLLGGILHLTILGVLDAPAGYDPSDWGPRALAGLQFVTSESNTCRRCHAAGGQAEELTGIHVTRDEAWEVAHMLNPSAIAPFDRDSGASGPRPEITPMQAQGVLAYLRRIRAGAVPPALSESDRLATLTFSNTCVTCHRISGEGGQSAPNLSRVGARRDLASIRRILIDPESEFPGATMPIFRGRLTDAEIDALSQYLANRR